MRSRIEGRVAVVSALAALLVPVGASAYGVEIPENGTVAFGRGGAFMVRASDPSTVMHNVAGIVGLRGFQFTIGSNLGSFSHCFQRGGINGNTYEANADVIPNTMGTVFGTGADGLPTYGGQAFPEVCKEPALALAPMIMGTYRINRYIGIGFGVTAPSTPGSGQNFADVVTLSNGVRAPSPARHLLFRKNLLVIYPTLAVSVQPHRIFRVGLSVQPSFGSFGFGLMANADRANPQSPASDTLIDLSAQAFFLAGALGVQVLPNRYFSFAAQAHYNFPIDASGTATTRFNTYGADATGPNAPVEGQFTINSMRITLPWDVRVGARFSFPRAGAQHTQDDGSGEYDPMRDDLFDVEVMYRFERTSMLSDTALSNTGSIAGPNIPAPAEISISSALSDVHEVRLGGDWNILPNRLAARVGFSYSTAGASPELAQIHLPAYAGGSIHLGGTWRITRHWDLNLGFGHFIFAQNDASNGRRAIVVPSPQIDPNGAECQTTGQQACAVNQGVYRASFTAGSISVTGRF